MVVDLEPGGSALEANTVIVGDVEVVGSISWGVRGLCDDEGRVDELNLVFADLLADPDLERIASILSEVEASYLNLHPIIMGMD